METQNIEAKSGSLFDPLFLRKMYKNKLTSTNDRIFFEGEFLHYKHRTFSPFLVLGLNQEFLDDWCETNKRSPAIEDICDYFLGFSLKAPLDIVSIYTAIEMASWYNVKLLLSAEHVEILRSIHKYCSSEEQGKIKLILKNYPGPVVENDKYANLNLLKELKMEYTYPKAS